MVIEWIIAALLAAGTTAAIIHVVELGLSAVKRWLSTNKTSRNQVGSIVKTRLDNGEYRVVVGLVSSGTVVKSQSWQAERLDRDLRVKMGSRDSISLKV